MITKIILETKCFLPRLVWRSCLPLWHSNRMYLLPRSDKYSKVLGVLLQKLLLYPHQREQQLWWVQEGMGVCQENHPQRQAQDLIHQAKVGAHTFYIFYPLSFTEFTWSGNKWNFWKLGECQWISFLARIRLWICLFKCSHKTSFLPHFRWEAWSEEISYPRHHHVQVLVELCWRCWATWSQTGITGSHYHATTLSTALYRCTVLSLCQPHMNRLVWTSCLRLSSKTISPEHEFSAFTCDGTFNNTYPHKPW